MYKILSVFLSALGLVWWKEFLIINAFLVGGSDGTIDLSSTCFSGRFRQLWETVRQDFRLPVRSAVLSHIVFSRYLHEILGASSDELWWLSFMNIMKHCLFA